MYKCACVRAYVRAWMYGYVCVGLKCVRVLCMCLMHLFSHGSALRVHTVYLCIQNSTNNIQLLHYTYLSSLDGNGNKLKNLAFTQYYIVILLV